MSWKKGMKHYPEIIREEIIRKQKYGQSVSCFKSLEGGETINQVFSDL